MLRVFAGVDEALLDRIPQERARYTSVGGVVLGTATIAAFSMWFAISQTLGYQHPLVVVPVLIWGLFVLNVDRWLVSSSLGSGWQRRLPLLLMRLLLAGFIGVVVAEPLVMRIFETAIEQQVRDGRAEQRAELRAQLLRCNPPTRTLDQQPAAGCQDHLLSFDETPASRSQLLAARRQDAEELRDVVDTDAAEHAALEELARRECAGDTGTGLTGIRGVGPNCTRLRGQANSFQETHQIAGNVSRLAALDAEISQLEIGLRGAEARFERDRAVQIAGEVDQLAHPLDLIGFLERLDALHTLAAQGTALTAGTWAVRLFFILVDCLPILIKIFGGTASYDRLVENRLTAAESWHDIDLDTAHSRTEARARQDRAEIDLGAREHAVSMKIRLADAIDRLAERRAQDSNGARHGGPGSAPRTDARLYDPLQ
jgi:hypothetical protein